jgi:putative ABC transport system permease protein
MLADLRDALRQLRKAPGFTATAIITLALGIGATTAIFSLVQQVMLKSLPVTKPEELWRIGDKIRCCNWGGYTQGEDGDFSLFSWEAYKNFRANTPEFVDLAALQAGNSQLGVRRAGAQGPIDTRNGEYVSGNFFRTLGVQPWIGRMMTDSDDQIGAPLVAVLSYRIWQEKYGADPSVVGASFQINGHPFTIIGVAPPGFYGAKLSGWGMPDIWLPITSEQALSLGAVSHLTRPNGNYLDIVGRVRPGVDPKSLEAKLRGEFHNWLASHVSDMEPGEKQLWEQQTIHLIPGDAGVADMRDNYQAGLKLLLVAAGCVLLVACGNLANLMLARGLKDRAQTSMRVALGASRWRLVRRALVECVVLSLIGGVIGIGVAYAGTRLILYLAFTIGSNNYVPVSATPSWPVLLFTLGVSLLTGIVFGIAPAWMTSHANPVEALRGANRSVGGRRSWAQKSLVIGQAAMSLVLLSSAALLSRSLRNLEHQEFGFESAGRFVAWVNPTLGTYKPEQMDTFYREIDDRLRQIPGVRMVAPVTYAPMSGDSWNEGIRIEGRPEPGAKEDTSAGWARVTSGFFDALGAKMLVGRPITEEDTASTRNVAVINEAFAKRFFKNQNPIGQHFGIDRIRYAGTYEIIGVVKDIRYMTWGYKDPVGPMFWVSEAQNASYDDPQFSEGEKYSHFLYNIVIWAPGDPPGMKEKVRKALASVDPDLVLDDVVPYPEVVSNDFHQENMIATLTSLFGGLGLVLAAVGLYGVMAYSVEQRTSEIGLRMALGADRGSVMKMVLRGAFSQVGIGLALGIPAAIGAGKLITDQLFGVKPWDPVMLTIATLLLGLAALLASVVPARRAAGVEPMVALRNE